MTLGPRVNGSRVSLNSVNYAIARDENGDLLPIEMYPVQVEGASFRPVGTLRRNDNTKINRYVFNNWAQVGIGCQRLRRTRIDEHGTSSAQHVGGMRFSTLETRFDPMITLQLLNDSQTHAANADHAIVFVGSFNGDAWVLFEEEYAAGSDNDTVARKFAGTANQGGGSWGNGGTVQNNSTTGLAARIWDGRTHKGKLYALGITTNSNPETFGIYSSSDGATWASAAGTGWQTDDGMGTEVKANDWTQGYGALIDYGNTLLACTYSAANTIKIQKTTDAAANWSQVTDITGVSTNPIRKGIVWRDILDLTTTKPYLVTTANVYYIDITNSTAFPILPDGVLGGSDDEARACTVGADGNLYVSTANGDILQISVPLEGRIYIRNVGPQSKAHGEDGDGLPTAYQGHGTYAIDLGQRWLCVAYGGHAAGKNATILAMDYQTQAWHCVYAEADANVEINLLGFSTEDDGSPRLFFALEHASSSEMYGLFQPLVSSITGVAHRYQSSGYVQFSEDDLDDPFTDSAIFQSFVDVDGLTSVETIVHEYGTESQAITAVNAWSASTAVTYFTNTSGTTVTSFQWGSGQGVSANVLRNMLTFNRGGTATNSPKMKEFEFQARPKISVLNGFRVPIDIDLTAAMNRTTNETVVNNLLTVRDSVTNVAFVLGEDASQASITYNVECVALQGQVFLDRPNAPGAASVGNKTKRRGVIVVSLEEVL